ncbi:MAG: hypothetical protein ACREJC_08805, partial [Tepidisphaeraceae bacterium]
SDVGWSETDLLGRYLDRDHAFRTGQVSITEGAVVDTQAIINGDNAYKSLTPLVGADGITKKGFVAALSGDDHYLWGAALGGGSHTSVGNIMNSDMISGVSNGPIPGIPIKAVFTMLAGSYFGDYNGERPFPTEFDPPNGDVNAHNFMRSVLASEGDVLTTEWEFARPWHYHTMGLGETIGDAELLTQNDTGLYGDGGPAQVTTNLLGDPTLRMNPIGPVSSLSGRFDLGMTLLEWGASTDSTDAGFQGYYVYRSEDPDGPFDSESRITAGPIADEYFYDETADPHERYYYMVRAVKLMSTEYGTTFSGSYFAGSVGQFIDAGEWITEGGGGGGENGAQQGGGGEEENDGPQTAVEFLGSDDTTHGDWTDTYGGGGYVFASGASSLPEFVNFDVIDQIDQLWDEDSDEIGA